MAKYRALTLIWNDEIQMYVQPGEEFEVQNDEYFPQLIEMGVVAAIPEPAPVKNRSKKAEVTEDGSNNERDQLQELQDRDQS